MHRLGEGEPLDGPVSLLISLFGSEIIAAAVKGAKLKRAVKLAS